LPGSRFQEVQTGLQKVAVAAEPVDDQPLNPRTIFRLEQLERADQTREYPASVDVADQQNRRGGPPRPRAC